jgi:hypothetical protein
MTDQPTERDLSRPTSDTTDELATDRPSDRPEGGDQGGTMNRPGGPDFGASPLEDETPGSQGEIESGSEGDFGGSDDRIEPS